MIRLFCIFMMQCKCSGDCYDHTYSHLLPTVEEVAIAHESGRALSACLQRLAGTRQIDIVDDQGRGHFWCSCWSVARFRSAKWAPIAVCVIWMRWHIKSVLMWSGARSSMRWQRKGRHLRWDMNERTCYSHLRRMRAYPAPLRDFLMRLALTDLYRARWTGMIHDEWTR